MEKMTPAFIVPFQMEKNESLGRFFFFFWTLERDDLCFFFRDDLCYDDVGFFFLRKRNNFIDKKKLRLAVCI